MSYVKPLLSLDYWFNLNPAPFIKPVFIGLGIALVVLLVGGLIVKWIGYKTRKNPPTHRILSRIGRALISIALAGGLIYFFSYEQTRLVSARFWWLVILLGAIVWKVFILIDIWKRYPREKAAFADRLNREKYLPK